MESQFSFSLRFLQKKRKMLCSTTIPTSSSSSLFAKKTTTARSCRFTRDNNNNNNHNHAVVKVMASSAGDGGPNEVFSSSSLLLSPKISFCLRVVVLNTSTRAGAFRRNRRRNRFESFEESADPVRSVVFFFFSLIRSTPPHARALTNDVPLRYKSQRSPWTKR